MDFTLFFGHDIDYSKSFILFSLPHFLFIGFVVIVSTITFIYAKRIHDRKNQLLLRNSFLVLLISLEIWYHVHNWSYPRFSAPLHLCSFSTILSTIVIFTKNKKAFDILFFTGILGGAVAVLLPDNNGYTYLTFRYYHFILLHTLIIVVPIYFRRAYDFQITKKSANQTFLYLIAVIPVIYLSNYLSGSNYMFFNAKPDIIASILPPWPYYILIFIVLAYGLIMGIYYLQRPRQTI